MGAMENTFSAFSPEPKGQLALNMVGNVEVIRG